MREEFIKKSKEKYGDKFKYDLVGEDVRVLSTVTLICNVHGEFDTKVVRHMSRKSGCPKCKIPQKHKDRSFPEFKKEVESFGEVKILSRGFKGTVLKKELLYVQTKFGICKTTAGNLIKSKGATIKSAINPTEYFKRTLRDTMGYNGILLDELEYNGALNKCVAKCSKHGYFNTKPNWLLSRKSCFKCGVEVNRLALLSNTEDFIEKAISRLGTKRSIYDKVNYTHAKSKILIYCEGHKDYYEVTPNSHLNGSGCRFCYDLLNVYSKTDYIKVCGERKPMLYFVNFYNEKESFMKIGITVNSVKYRFSKGQYANYKYKIIHEEVGEAGYIWELEKEALIHFLEYKYEPKDRFQGYTECFTKDLTLKKLKDFIYNFNLTN